MAPQQSVSTLKRRSSRRSAAAVAKASPVEQVPSTPSSHLPESKTGLTDSELSDLTDDDDEQMDFTPRGSPTPDAGNSVKTPLKNLGDWSPSRSPTVKRTYARKDRAFLPDPRTLTTPNASSSSPKVPMTPMSPLTPMTPSTQSPSKSTRAKPPSKLSAFGSPLSALPTTPTKRKRAVLADLGGSDEELSPTQASPSKRRNVAKSVVMKEPNISTPKAKPASRSQPSKVAKRDWSLDLLGRTVWVKVNSRNEVVSDNKKPGRTFWWPAKVTSTPTPSSVKVALFNPPNPVASTPDEVGKPSAANIRPQYDGSGKERFDKNTYTHNTADAPTSDGSGIDFESRWHVAVSQMHEEEDKHEDFPDTLAAILSQTSQSVHEDKIQTNEASATGPDAEAKPTKGGRKSKANAKPVIKSKKEIFREQWTPSPDGTLQIPGELVLSLEKKRNTLYWPGTIAGFTPPSDETKVGKYLVKMFDGMEVLATRQMFYTTGQDEFATCKLGELRPPPPLRDGGGSGRSPSPEPSIPPPSAIEFNKLTIRQQFAYVKPILVSILNDEFPPAKEQHDAYMSGGPKRVEVCRKLGAKGNMRNDEYEALTECIQSWALRGERRAKYIFDEGEQQNLGQLNGDVNSATGRSEAKANGDIVPTESDNSNVPHAISNDETEKPIENVSVTEPSPGEPLPLSVTKSTDEKVADEPSNVPSSRTPVTSADHAPSGTPSTRNGTVEQNSGNTTLSSRLRGCPAYERLSQEERIDYCSSILLQEAVYQLLLWRNGERTAVQRSSDEEEERLRDIGIEKATEVNVWPTVRQLREMKRKELRLPPEVKSEARTQPTESSSRTRRRNNNK